jgi:hypothetical protein
VIQTLARRADHRMAGLETVFQVESDQALALDKSI